MNDERIKRDVVTIGASAGGVEALLELFGRLPDNLPCTIGVVLHRRPYYEWQMPRLLQSRSGLICTEPSDGERIESCHVYLAPRDQHMLFDRGIVRLSRGATMHFTRPATDPLFTSAAEAYGPRVVGVVLSGTGSDGVSGLVAIKAAGGLSLVQRPDEARYPEMPTRGILGDHVDAVLGIPELADALLALSRGAVVSNR